MKKIETSIGALLCEFLNQEIKECPELKDRPSWIVHGFANKNNLACEAYDSSGRRYGAEKYISVLLGGHHYELIYKSTFLFFFRKRWQLLPKKQNATGD